MARVENSIGKPHGFFLSFVSSAFIKVHRGVEVLFEATQWAEGPAMSWKAGKLDSEVGSQGSWG